MKFDWKNSLIHNKFKILVLSVSMLLLIVFCSIAYIGVKSTMYSAVENNIKNTFMGVNKDLINNYHENQKPIIAGILNDDEIVYIISHGQTMYQSPVPPKAKQNMNLHIISAKEADKKNPIEVKLYVDMNRRVNNYFGIIYKLVIPGFAAVIILIIAFAILLLGKLTRNLNSFVRDIKDNETIGIDFNNITVYDTNDEAGILSREFVKLNSEIIRLKDKERQFVHDAYYNFKNPLAMMEANLGIMEKRNLSDEGRNVAREAMKTILFDTKETLDNLLDLNREEIIVKEKVETINLADIVLEIVEEYKKIYPTFSFKTDLDSLTTNIRKVDIVKLINILLENAVKYSTEELKEVVIKIKAKGKRYYLIFEDYGVGLTAENTEKVFDLFWKYDNKRAISMGGVGMGLAIAKKICTKYKFNIKFSSQLNIGTTVIVELNS